MEKKRQRHLVRSRYFNIQIILTFSSKLGRGEKITIIFSVYLNLKGEVNNSLIRHIAIQGTEKVRKQSHNKCCFL